MYKCIYHTQGLCKISKQIGKCWMNSKKHFLWDLLLNKIQWKRYYNTRHPHFNTLRPRQLDAISQTTFSNTFSWMKMFEFRLKFHWILFPMVQLIIFQYWFRWWLGADQATSHYLNQWWLDYRRIYASLGLNELTANFVMPQFSTMSFWGISCCESRVKYLRVKYI